MTQSAYQINTELLITSLLPVANRLPIYEALLESYDAPLQRLNDNMVDYITGSSYSVYSNSFTYSIGDRVLATASNLFSIYESQIDNNYNIALGLTAWNVFNEFKIGMFERSHIRANIMVFEYGLNQYYGTTFNQPNGLTMSTTHSDIYITDIPVVYPVFLIGSSHFGTSTSDGFIFGTGSTASFIEEHALGTANYNINVPNALLTSLPATFSNVKVIAEKYNTIGVRYNIIGY